MDSVKEEAAMNNSVGQKILLEPIAALEKPMKKSKRKWMIIGGAAASLLGKPRFTADIDAVIAIGDEDILAILRLANEMGLAPRIKKAADFAKKNKALLLMWKIFLNKDTFPIGAESVCKMGACAGSG